MPLNLSLPLLRLSAVLGLSLNTIAAMGAPEDTSTSSVSPVLQEDRGSSPHGGPSRLETALVRFELSPKRDVIQGTFHYVLPAGLPVLILHPNAYAAPPDALTDVRYRWLYPGAFSPGGITVTGLWLEPALAEGLPPDRPTQTAQRLPLPADSTARLLPLPELQGRQGVLTGTFETRIPLRFGSFGRYREQVTLEGGFFPLLATAPQAGDPSPLQLPLRRFTLIEEHSTGNHAPLRQKVTGRAPYFVARGGQGLETQVRQPGLPLVRVHWMPWSGERRRQRLHRVLEAALRDWQAGHPGGTLIDSRPLVFEQAPLRDELTFPVDGAVLFSDRLYRVSALFADFHDLELRRCVFEQLYLRILEQNSASAAAHETAWLAEALAWRALRQAQPEDRVAPSIQDRLGLFTVIPIIDRLLHNPNYPMGATYAQRMVRIDPFAQHLASTLGGETSGTLLLYRLEALLGSETLQRLLERMLEPEAPSFESLLSAHDPRAVPLLKAWREPPREGNYALELRDVPGSAGGALELRITRAAGQPTEPLVLEVQTRPSLRLHAGHWSREAGHSQRQRIWFGTPERTGTAEEEGGDDAAGTTVEETAGSAMSSAPGLAGFSSHQGARAVRQTPVGLEEQRVSLRLEQPLERVLLDPDQVLLESNRADNQYPVEWSWLLWDFLFSNNGTLNGQDSFLSFLINLHYKDTLLSRRILEVESWSQEESFGAALGYLHYFGKKRTVYRWEHELSARLEYRNLNQAFELEEVVGGGAVVPLDAALTLRGGYSFENRLNPYTPIRGAALDLKGMVGVGITEAGTLSDSFGALSLHVRRLFPITEVHGLAARLKLETYLWGDTIPEMNTFLLGGEEELRSLPPRAIGGLSKVLISLEDRHPLLLDLDLNLLLFRLREARGVAFIDAGTVADRTFQQLAGADWHLAIGYGLRFNIDLFGLSPLLFAVNVAIPLDSLIRERRLPRLEDIRRMESSSHAF